MYVQQKFQETRLDVLHALVRQHPLGALIVNTAQGLDANHMPFHLDAAAGTHGTLRAHIPRGNPAWKEAIEGDALVIFQGSQGYITPSWYPSKHAHGEAVPTWNYAVVHAYGRVRFIEDREWLRAHVDALTQTHEASQKLPWQISDAPPDYIDRMLAQIVGVEMELTRITGKWKMSQNRPPGDRLGVVAGLASLDSIDARDMRELVARYDAEQQRR